MVGHVTLIRPNIGDFRSSDAMTPLAFAALAAQTPEEVELKLIDERLDRSSSRQQTLLL